MTAFHIVNALVTSLFSAHSGGSNLLMGAEQVTFMKARRELLAEHGWDEHEFEARVDDYASDCESPS